MKFLELRPGADAHPNHPTVKVPLPPVEALHLYAFVPNVGMVRIWATPNGYGPDAEISEVDLEGLFTGPGPTTQDDQRRFDEAAGLAFDLVCKGLTQYTSTHPIGAPDSDARRKASVLECIARMRAAEQAALDAFSDLTWSFRGWGALGGAAIQRLPMREVRDLDALAAAPSPSACALAELIELLRGEAVAWSKDYAETCRMKWEETHRPERDLDPELGI